jgi:enterochelin esterase family protein
VPVFDPHNAAIKANLVFKNNAVRVSGPTPQPWDLADVPHGVLHRHTYASKIIQGLPNSQEEYYVYTPPGYDPAGSVRYPVLYLLHGWSGGADDWTEAGQVHVMLDNFIAEGRVVPMIAVMPQSYGAMSFVHNGFKAWDDPAQIAQNIELFGQALRQEIIPQIDGHYRTSGDRALAGLSMGGGQSLLIGLNQPETFGWVGAMSSALPYAGYDGLFPRMPSTGPAHLLWIACATEEEDIVPTRQLVAWLRARGVSPTSVETPGTHNWHTWRNNFVQFAPLLFRENSPDRRQPRR